MSGPFAPSARPIGRLLLLGVTAAFAAGLLLANSVYIVDQRRQVVVLRLGAPQRVVNAPGADDPGLKFKWPLIESLVVLDKRGQGLETARQEVVGADGRPLLVSALLRYRIVDPLAFWRAVRDEDGAHERLGPLIDGALRRAFAGATQAQILSQNRDALTAAALLDARAAAARAHLGLQMIDLRLERADPGPAEAQADFERLRGELEARATRVRADGNAAKQAIMADADRQVSVAIAAATEQAFTTRGQGDAEAARIYAASFGQDPDFAAFYRSLQAYEGSLAGDDTTIVLPADSDFLKYFRKGPEAK